jgi:DNA topoisomerase-2
MIDVPKLEDAHFAGTKNALDCSLILTEGDSAKALAVSGLEIVGRQNYGVLPLRGKILNVRVATPSQLSQNQEIINICKSLGLDFSKTYQNGLEGNGLRY